MRSNGKASGIVKRDSCNWLKRSVFRRLNVIARSKQIAVIFQVMGQEDPSTNRYECRYKSIGPAGLPDMCLFCGWGTKDPKDFVHLGQFVADDTCHRDFLEGLGVTFLERRSYRPDVIIIPIDFPGSLDEAILDLAWGLAFHELSSRSHLISPARLKREAHTQAARLVRKLEAQLT